MFIKEEPVSNFANGLFFHLKCVKKGRVTSGGEDLLYSFGSWVESEESAFITSKSTKEHSVFQFGDKDTMSVGKRNASYLADGFGIEIYEYSHCIFSGVGV